MTGFKRNFLKFHDPLSKLQFRLSDFCLYSPKGLKNQFSEALYFLTVVESASR